MNNVPGWLAVILAPGAAGFVWVVFKGIDLWRNGTAAQEARAIGNLEKFAERESFRADRNQDLLDYYRSWAGTLEWTIRVKLGPEQIPERPALPPPPPRSRRTTDVLPEKK